MGVGKQAGFTLLEILVALGMLALVLGAVYGSHRAVTASIADLEPRRALEQEGRFFMQRLSSQIRCCYGGHPDQLDGSTPERASKDQTSFRKIPLLFLAGDGLLNQTLLRFVTSKSALWRNSGAGCLAVVSYKADVSQRALLTQEQVYDPNCENNDDNWRVILEDLSSIEFEYFDGADWQAEWDSGIKGGPPKAARIKLVLRSEHGGCVSFMSVAPILCSRVVDGQATVPGIRSTREDVKK